MIKNYLSFILILFSLITRAQSLAEILSISLEKPSGTARFESMGGAFGSLGGDLSSININPAGGAVFIDNEFGFTISVGNTKNNSLFFNNNETTNNFEFSLNQGGGVWLLKNYGEGNINQVTFGINYQTVNSYEDMFDSKGKNTKNSIDNFFLNNSLGYSVTDLSVNSNESISSVYKYLGEYYGYSGQQTFLGYQSYILSYNDDSKSFYSLVDMSEGVDQHYTNESKGANTKYNYNLSIQYKENYYFGLNVNVHSIYKSSFTRHFENNFSEKSPIKSITFENDLVTQGEGVSIQLGTIAKFNSFRLGLSYQTPTWYTLWDETYQYIETSSQDLDGNTFNNKIDPRITNVYPKYKITSPSILTASTAVIFGKIGLLSLDIISKNYSKIKLKPTKEFSFYNNEINSKLTNTLDFRLGTEFRLQKTSLRAGYQFYGSPYKNSEMTNDYSTLAFGFGYDFGNTTLSVSHKISESKRKHQLFDSGLTDLTQIDSNTSFSMLSLIFKF
jgi:hypothetical protein|tara:strand:+ start:1147 stop:2652 length:1506 start_codon:yes stop_codon:yes gene_type:complete